MATYFVPREGERDVSSAGAGNSEWQTRKASCFLGRRHGRWVSAWL